MIDLCDVNISSNRSLADPTGPEQETGPDHILLTRDSRWKQCWQEGEQQC